MRHFGTPALLLVVVLAAAGSTGCASRGIDVTQAGDQLAFGVRMARSNLWREALFRFERAVTLDPSNAMALNNLAVAYEGIGEFDKAKDAYARALRLDKSNQYIQKNYSRFVEFASRNRKREQEPPEEEPLTAEAEPEEAPAEPVQVSQPEEPPKPGEIPVSDLPPDPVPPVPQTPPETPPPPRGGAA
ncbi:MAG: tetratricopeptide repeat protein [Thermoanaerobaculia bacterium]